MKLADIAFVTRRFYKGSICVSPDEFDLLIRAVRQLGTAHLVLKKRAPKLVDHLPLVIDLDVMGLIAEGTRKGEE